MSPSHLLMVMWCCPAPQPFSKSATEHVQSRLSKKQVPPDLFQVSAVHDVEGMVALGSLETAGLGWQKVAVET
mgnify:CR=1 FL=1